MLVASICLYFTLGSCGLAIGLIILRYDLYQRAPWYLVLAAVALGAAAMWTAGEAQLAIIRAINADGAQVGNVSLAAIAATTEELAKLSVVALIWIIAARRFCDPLDGLVYGSFAGLGAALEESLAVLSQSHINGYLPPQEPVRLAGHLVMGGIAGFGMGLLPTRSKWAIPTIIACLGAAVGLHTVWDVAAFSAADHFRGRSRLESWHTAIPIALMLSGMVAYRRLAVVGARLTRRHLQLCDINTHQGPDD